MKKTSIILLFIIYSFFSMKIQAMTSEIQEKIDYFSNMPNEIILIILQELARQHSLFDALKTLQRLTSTSHQFAEIIFKDHYFNDKLMQALLPLIQNKSFMQLIREYENAIRENIVPYSFKPVSKEFRSFYAQLLHKKFKYPINDILGALGDQRILNNIKLRINFPHMPDMGAIEFFENVKKGNLARVYAFIKAGLDVNKVPYISYIGTLPLIYATKAGNKEMVELLLDGGADPDTEDFYDKTALEYALELKDKELINIINTIRVQKA